MVGEILGRNGNDLAFIRIRTDLAADLIVRDGAGLVVRIGYDYGNELLQRIRSIENVGTYSSIVFAAIHHARLVIGLADDAGSIALSGISGYGKCHIALVHAVDCGSLDVQCGHDTCHTGV